MQENRQVHELIDRLAPSQLAAVHSLLHVMVDPVSTAIANAPFDDEPESEYERRAVLEAKDWFNKNLEGIPFAEVLADCGPTPEDIKNKPISK